MENAVKRATTGPEGEDRNPRSDRQRNITWIRRLPQAVLVKSAAHAGPKPPNHLPRFT